MHGRFLLKKKHRLFYKQFINKIKKYYIIPLKTDNDVLCIVNKVSEVKGYITDKKDFTPDNSFIVFHINFHKNNFSEEVEWIKKYLQQI